MPQDTVAALVWYRNCDLRILDHAPLSAAASRSTWLIPFFCLSAAQLSCRTDTGVSLGTPQLGPHKLRFLLESVADLGVQLMEGGTELLTLLAEPEQIQAAHTRGLQSRISKFWGATLYHPEDLPHQVFKRQESSQGDDEDTLQKFHKACQSMPGIMTKFRKAVDEHTQRLHSFLGSSAGAQQSADRQHAPIEDFKAQRMMAGCMKMHLQIRDFFIFTAVKAGDDMLRQSGLANKDKSWHWDADLSAKWARGQTGFPFVDACMRELAATGYMSNRGRQNCASFLTKGLKLDWRYGAHLFESLLVDHDFAVNYVNWNYFAGIGNDPRDRVFRTVTQGLNGYSPAIEAVD
ncbi:hypothetical protein WJX73_001627 [Symbiochloris irregularis]|uniref:Photolyase/cryptochrome alpha/beta domain-containing protein n=1 Tax=Symbiochloris irregularis TaxID=706552 RepID=A0AAW1NZ77_9CHLO